MHVRWRLALVIAGLWFGPLLVASGQGDVQSNRSSNPLPSHLPLLDGSGPLSARAAENLLDEHLDAVQSDQDSRRKLAIQLAQQFLRNPNTLDRLKDLSEDQQQQLLKIAQKYQKGGLGGNLKKPSDQDAKEMVDLIRSLERYKVVPPTQASDPQLARAIQEQAAKEHAAGDRGGSGSRKSKEPRSKSAEKSSANSKNNPLQARLLREMTKLSEKLASNNAFTKSPAMNRWVQGLKNFQGGSASAATGGENSLLAKLGIESTLGKLFSPQNLKFVPDLPSPSLPQWSSLLAPTAGGGGVGLSVTQPGTGGFSTDGLWRGLFWLAFVGSGVVLFWWLLVGKPTFKAAANQQATGAERLGAWPVQPGQIRTHQQFVLAFDHLSLLLLGNQARAWNHREIEGTLTSAAIPPARREAIRSLAELYENARYAPDTAELPEEEWVQAREHLLFLAGGLA